MFYKAINGWAVCNLPPFVSPSTGDTWTSHDPQYTQPKQRTDTYIYSYFPRTIRIWNILPTLVVYAPDPDIFKKAILEQFTGRNIYAGPPRRLFDQLRLGSFVCFKLATICLVY